MRFSQKSNAKNDSPFNHVQTSGLGARATSHYLWWLNSASTSNKGFAEVMAATQKCRTRFLKVKGKPCNVISGWMLWGSERLQSGSPSIWCEHMRPHWVNVQMEDGWAQSVLLRKWEDCRREDSLSSDWNSVHGLDYKQQKPSLQNRAEDRSCSLWQAEGNVGRRRRLKTRSSEETPEEKGSCLSFNPTDVRAAFLCVWGEKKRSRNVWTGTPEEPAS